MVWSYVLVWNFFFWREVVWTFLNVIFFSNVIIFFKSHNTKWYQKDLLEDSMIFYRKSMKYSHLEYSIINIAWSYMYDLCLKKLFSITISLWTIFMLILIMWKGTWDFSPLIACWYAHKIYSLNSNFQLR